MPRNRISFVVTFDKPEGVKVSDMRLYLAKAIKHSYWHSVTTQGGVITVLPDISTLEVKRLRKPPSR